MTYEVEPGMPKKKVPVGKVYGKCTDYREGKQRSGEKSLQFLDISS